MSQLSSVEIAALFEYFDSITVDNKISVEEIQKAAAPDLDGDKAISDAPLYRSFTEQPSPFTGRPVRVYEYSTDSTKGEAYIVEGIHVSERYLGAKTVEKWLANFQEELADGFIDLDELKAKITAGPV